MSQAPGPSSGAQVGAINVGITGDTSGLQSKLAQAEAQVKASAAKMQATMAAPIGNKGAAFGRGTIGAGGVGMGAGVGVSSIGAATAEAAAFEASIDGTDRKAKGLLRTLSSVRQILTRIFLPVAIVGMWVRLTDAIKSARTEVERFDRAQRESAGATIRQINERIALMHAESEAQAALLRIEYERRAVADKFHGDMQTELKRMEDNWFSLSAVIRSWMDIFKGTDSIAEKFDVLNDAIDATNKSFDTLNRETEEFNKKLEESERIQRRMREQAKRDITHTTIDVSRIGPALDLLQRQRTNS